VEKRTTSVVGMMCETLVDFNAAAGIVFVSPSGVAPVTDDREALFDAWDGTRTALLCFLLGAVLTTAQGHLSLIVVVGLTPIDIDRRRRGVNVMYVLSSRGLLGASDMIPLSVLLKMEEGNSVVFTVRPGAIPVRVGMGPARTTHGCVRYDVRTPGLDGRPIRNSYRSRQASGRFSFIFFFAK
jgi:hypothetical protein